MNDEIFFDTNIICYAFDLREPAKRRVCERLIKQVLDGEIIGTVSNQVLGEVFNAAVNKLNLSPNQARIIVQGIIHSDKWHKTNYTQNTINSAAEKFERLGMRFWDLVISETMKENGVTEIITENEKDFLRISGIKITNPFKR